MTPQLSIVQPSNVELEAHVLGTLLQESSTILKAESILTANVFYKEEHKVIYTAIESLHNSGMEIDVLTVKTKLAKENLLKSVGDAVYLSLLTNSMSYNFFADANELKELYTKRELIKICQKTLRDINEIDTNEQLERIEKEVFLLSVNKGNDTDTLKNLSSSTLLAMYAQSKIDGFTGVESGFAALDKITGGFQAANLIVFGGATSMGKTAVGLNLALNAYMLNKKVAFFSLEMSKKQLVKRLLAIESNINSNMIRDCKGLDKDQWERLNFSVETFENPAAHFFIDDDSSITIQDLRIKARSLKQRFGLDILFIDYLQLIKTKDKGRTQEQIISQIASELHGLSKELDLPIITFSQINKVHEERTDKRPTLSGLRESAGIGNASDLVILIHRPEYYSIMKDENGNSTQGITELIIAKHRDGELGTIKIKFDPKIGKITDYEESNESLSPTATSDITQPKKTTLGASKQTDYTIKQMENYDENDIPF